MAAYPYGVIMKWIFFIFFLLFIIVIVWDVLTRKYISPFQLYLFFGKKGCGKSTLLQKLVVYYQKKGYTCYCNIGDCDLPNVIQIPLKDYLPQLAEAGHMIYHYKDFTLSHNLDKEFKEKGIKSPTFVKLNSVIFCDEINLFFDNRDFKNFSKEIQRYFRLQRHYRHIFIGFSQTYDCDKKIRDLADQLFIVTRFARIFVRTKSYVKTTVVVSPEGSNSRDTAIMTDDFKPNGLVHDLSSPFKCFLPYWVKRHDSFK